MYELEQTKNTIIQNIQKLCAHCVNGQKHDCPVQKISEQVASIKGIPLIVNDQFRGVIFR